ncbi:MAG TPA: Na+/H+ antiporter NhaA [Gemmatimonadaceae bacterium]|nr:Na+/H+ antiporter NhaA [Gemmatimonadaceae bacterium]
MEDPPTEDRHHMQPGTLASRTDTAPPAPARILTRVLRPFQRFAHTESSGGIVLLACTAVALAWANSPWAASYFHLWENEIAIGGSRIGITQSLHHWINDGLMVVFFFVVGLEIKREMLVGELASVRQAALPIMAALGGMLVPAALYATLNAGGPGAPGWGIPMATDIAFALGVLALLGPRVPVALKVFLAALAIVDDIGAVLVIAIFYTSQISLLALGIGAAVLALLVLCNAAGLRHPAVYALLGVVLWVAFLKSGVHATVSGVLLAMTIPSRTRINEDEFLDRTRSLLDEFERACGPETTVLTNRAQQEAIEGIEIACEQAQAPLLKMEHKLHGIVAFGIMPLFALSNAGVALGGVGGGALTGPVTLGVVLGLVLGKPIGITLFSWAAVRFGLAVLPTGVSWRTLHGVSWLGGIGFTMSLFIAGLAFEGSAMLDAAKVGILAASLIAGTVGWLLLRRVRGSEEPRTA